MASNSKKSGSSKSGNTAKAAAPKRKLGDEAAARKRLDEMKEFAAAGTPVVNGAEVPPVAGMVLGDMEAVLKGTLRRMQEREALRPRGLPGVNERVEAARLRLKETREGIQRARVHLIAAMHEEKVAEDWLRTLEEMRGVFMEEE